MARAGDTSIQIPEILARGPWEVEQVDARWLDDPFEPTAEKTEAADAAIRGLQERGSPSHDGVAARLVDFRQDEHGISLELQPLRWALRLVPADASHSMAALCVTRAADGRWLAGRRAPWVSSWAGRWALGAGGAVDARAPSTRSCASSRRSGRCARCGCAARR
jgi:8-oxo-dGTP diphosphatase